MSLILMHFAGIQLKRYSAIMNIGILKHSPKVKKNPSTVANYQYILKWPDKVGSLLLCLVFIHERTVSSRYREIAFARLPLGLFDYSTLAVGLESVRQFHERKLAWKYWTAFIHPAIFLTCFAVFWKAARLRFTSIYRLSGSTSNQTYFIKKNWTFFYYKISTIKSLKIKQFR